jgi:hypothetical protein
MKIVNRWTGKTIAEGATITEAIAAAPRTRWDGADLTGADLRRADLTGANLTGANLTGADLRRADLRRADLTDANLTDADLTGADLAGANLTGANLRRANLTEAQEDLFAIYDLVPKEVPAVLQALREGRVDGSTYQGDCACLVGTIANVKGVRYDELPSIRPNCSRPAERLFLGISRGDIPATNPIVKVVEEWTEEWLNKQLSVDRSEEGAGR